MEGGIAASGPDYNVDRVIFKARGAHSDGGARPKCQHFRAGTRPAARFAG
jgi:hypothetical protein